MDMFINETAFYLNEYFRRELIDIIFSYLVDLFF